MTTSKAYLSEVETSDIYVGILGKHYGKPLPSRFSATHSEYLHPGIAPRPLRYRSFGFTPLSADLLVGVEVGLFGRR
jgi:hypothetical protein